MARSHLHQSFQTFAFSKSEKQNAQHNTVCLPIYAPIHRFLVGVLAVVVSHIQRLCLFIRQGYMYYRCILYYSMPLEATLWYDGTDVFDLK